jgi:hypothetical protein
MIAAVDTHDDLLDERLQLVRSRGRHGAQYRRTDALDPILTIQIQHV